MMRDDTASVDEVRRVHRYECGMVGHRWSEIMEIGKQDPTHLVCSHCGRMCEVLPGRDA